MGGWGKSNDGVELKYNYVLLKNSSYNVQCVDPGIIVIGKLSY